MYLTLAEHKEELLVAVRPGGSYNFDENVVRAVAIADAEHKATNQMVREQKDGNECLSLTYEEVGFLEEVDEIDDVYRKNDTVTRTNRKRAREVDKIHLLDHISGGVLEATRDDSEETVVSDEKSEDYDFENMRKLIVKEYPAD
ncbi:unnamed protein product [Arabidopsis arenosa]|uniref:Uncharacterized protein n=1 Tax=Arabidopsis arenosa TaxID=38785 RepID=A0A8S1ZGS8_ARAAE|nr:unnamed protein product [Arabidopsis arenosa]